MSASNNTEASERILQLEKENIQLQEEKLALFTELNKCKDIIRSIFKAITVDGVSIINEEVSQKTLKEILHSSVDLLKLSTRSKEFLSSINITLIGELVQVKVDEVIKWRTLGLGRKGIFELFDSLSKYNLDFDMTIPDFPDTEFLASTKNH